MSEQLDAYAEGFRRQVHWCAALGSPFSAALLAQAADALEAGEDFIGLYMPWWQGKTAADISADVVALRYLGCAHALALSGRVGELAAHYPSCGGNANADGLWARVLKGFEAHADFTRAFVRQPPQTNEVGRAGMLMPGLLELARLTAMPLSLFEIGASAGLLQGLDRFHYTFGDVAYGDETAACRIAPVWHLPTVPPVDAPLEIVARRACDFAPINVTGPDGAGTDNAGMLRSYIWADMTARLKRFDGALAVARALRPVVEEASADHWLEEVLAVPGVPGVARCVFHSVMWQYMPQEARMRAFAAIARAGEAATADAPFAWLRFEPEANNKPMQLVLALWRDGVCETRLLAQGHPHGSEIGWHGWDAGTVLDGPALVQSFD